VVDRNSQVETPPAVRQLTREDLKGMNPEQIEAARKEGALDQLLGRTPGG